MASTPVAIGEQIAGKYLIERVIGEGGMGLVVAARHLELDQTVAIKFLLTEIAQLERAAERFKREAWAAARIRGEHVCRVLDVGTLPNGVPYMVMEYLDGCDLATELVRRISLPVIEAVDYVLQACEALAEAHAAGVIHRDLKPANLFLARRADGTRGVKVLDFGVSKVLSEGGLAGLSLTRTQTLVGSPLYMSPEQLDSAKGVDVRTDIWALGVVLYELITGRTPFNGDSIAQLVSAVLHANPPTFEQLAVSAPAGLEQTLLRAMSKRREDRYSSIAELARDLVLYGPAHAQQSASRSARMLSVEPMPPLPGVPSIAVAGSVPHPPSASTAPVSPTPRESTPVGWERERSTNRKRAGVAAAVLLGTALAGGFLYVRSQGTDTRDGNDPDAANVLGHHSTEKPTPPAATKAEEPPPVTAISRPPETDTATAVLPAKSDAGTPQGAEVVAPTAAPMVAAPAAPAAERASSERSRSKAQPKRPSSRPEPVVPTPAAPPPIEPKPVASPNGISDFGGRR